MNLRSLQWPFLHEAQKWVMVPTQEELRAWLARGLTQPGKSKGGLAEFMGLHQSQITRMLPGKGKRRRIAVEEIPIIAKYLAVPPPGIDLRSEDIAAFIGEQSSQGVRVKGYVGAGGEAHYYAVEPGDLGSIEGVKGATDQTVAFHIIGRSLGEFFDRWHVVFDDVRRPFTDDLIGKLCVVGLSDDKVVVKKIQRGAGRGFNLLSNADSEPPMKNVTIEWAAEVKSLVRG